MNKEKLRNALYHRVRLCPKAHVCGDLSGSKDDDWIIIECNDKLGIRIKNIRTDLSPWIAFDQIHHYTSDTNRHFDGLNHGVLSLTIQGMICENNWDIEPIRFGHASPV